MHVVKVLYEFISRVKEDARECTIKASFFGEISGTNHYRLLASNFR
jgi:hypothetical protein